MEFVRTMPTAVTTRAHAPAAGAGLVRFFPHGLFCMLDFRWLNLRTIRHERLSRQTLYDSFSHDFATYRLDYEACPGSRGVNSQLFANPIVRIIRLADRDLRFREPVARVRSQARSRTAELLHVCSMLVWAPCGGASRSGGRRIGNLPAASGDARIGLDRGLFHDLLG